MKIKHHFYIIVLFISTFMACRSHRAIQLQENLQGILLEEKFNAMPMVDRVNSKGSPLCSTIYIYKPIALTQLDSLNGHFCSKIQGDLITKLVSDKNGHFNVHLPIGKYSVFVQYENAYYIPYFSGAKWTALFEIKKNEPTQLEIIVRGNTNIQ